MRIYDPRLGKFLSVDPLTKQYPELTPYQFASNRPIDGIDLDGLEFLKSDVARIEVRNGSVFLKVENLKTVTRRSYEMANETAGGAMTWNENGVQKLGNAVSTKIADIYFSNNGTPVNEMPKLAILNNPYDVNDQVSDAPSDPIRLPTGRDKNGNPVEPAVSTPSVAARGLAKSILVIDATITAAQSAINISISSEQDVVNSQIRNQLGKAYNVLTQGMGMVPKKYRNTNDLSSILNVILSGVNNTDNKEILKIGIDIYNKYKPEKVNKPAGLDHMPSNTIEVNKPVKEE